MTKDQANGTVKAAIGTPQERTGALIGSTDQETKRLAKQAEGRLQRASDDVKAAFRKSRHL